MSQPSHQEGGQAVVPVEAIEPVAPIGNAASPRRPSIEKPPIMTDSDFEDDQSFDDDDLGATAFHNLPEEIIQQILLVADPNAFASLIVLNSTWRRASQHAFLYAAQLMRCPSYSTSHKKAPDARQERLPQLRKLFAREVKRNLFDAYLRPNHTEIKLVSNSISSSSCPGGDGMAFSSSPKGHYLLAYNSSRIHILDLRGPTITVERELKILRRPAATCIKDDGSLLAVLLTEMQVDLYDLTQSPPKHSQSIILDHSPRAIALSPCGSVLAAAYEGGIEVQALNPGALATERRSVKCDGVDALAFSLDGTQILGTTVHSAQPNTVILTAPYYDPGAQMSNEDISALWTTSILFPNSSRDCSHAVLLQESSHEEAYWTITYDRSFETFRAVRIDDLRNGTTYFTGPISNTPSKLLPCTLPSASYTGELVAAGFQGKEVWLYGVPEDLEAVPDSSNNSLDMSTGAGEVVRSVSGSSMRSRPRTQDAGERRVPQWLLLCDKTRNTFVGGFKAAELSGVSTLKWVASFGDHSLKERLVITAKGATPAKPLSMDDDGMDFEDGGRLTLVDFDYGINDGCVAEITIEVGMQEPEVLEEERRDLETEVAIVRRRTVAQRRGNRSAMMRAATIAARPTPVGHMDEGDDDNDGDPLLPRRVGAVAAAAAPRPVSAGTEEIETNAALEEVEALDGPYSQTGPRSITTLRRAATAAANHRQRNPTIATGAPIEYRRADGRAEHPHESDADNWVPPPPPYQREDPGEAPVFLRHSMMSVTSTAPSQLQDEDTPPVPPLPPLPPVPSIPQEHRPSTASGGPTSSISALDTTRSARRQTYMPDHTVRTPITRHAHHRLSSYTAMPATSHVPLQPSIATVSSYVEDDIYNVSPPDTPRLQESVLGENRVGNGSDVSHTPTGGESINPSPSIASTTPYTGTQRSIPLVPRIQTDSDSSAQPVPQLRPVEHAMVEPSPAESTWNPHTAGTSYSIPILQSQTWPMPLPALSQGPATGHALTAPATSMTMSEIIAQQYPPPPLPASPIEGRSSSRQSSLVRRISTGFHLPRMRSRSRSESRSQSRMDDASVRETGRPRTAHSLYQRPQISTSGQLPLVAASPLAHGIHVLEQSRQTPDQPMIISTPTGIQGAFDAPTPTSLHSAVGTQIIAPVPQHPRPGQSPGIMRPAERLESIYYAQSQSQVVPDFLLQPPPVPPTVPSDNSAARSSSIFRRPSRAERSAAKNIADAKMKGWRPGRSKSKRAKKTKPQEPEFDMVSQSVWTDIAAPVAAGGRRATRFEQQQQQQQQHPQYHCGNHGYSEAGVQRPGKEKDKKCVVM